MHSNGVCIFYPATIQRPEGCRSSFVQVNLVASGAFIEHFQDPVRDSLSDDGDFAFVYSRGRLTGIQVTRADVRSLEAGQEARDALFDALARDIWQEELSSSDARGCLVLCSVFYEIVQEHGPAVVRSMTQRVNFSITLLGCSSFVRVITGGVPSYTTFLAWRELLRCLRTDRRPIRVGLLPHWRSSTRLAVVVPPGTLECAPLFSVRCVPWRLRF